MIGTEENGDGRNAIGSLQLLRAFNDDLLDRSRRMDSATERRHLFVEFIGRAVASGALFPGPTERRTIQGIIDYWVASYNSIGRDLRGEARGRLPDTTLRRYEPELVKELVRSADDAIAPMNEKQRATAKRILLRLATPFAEPTTWEGIVQELSRYSKSADSVGLIVRTLVERRVLAVHGKDERLFIRADALLREWPFLADPLRLRTELWQTAHEWARSKEDPEMLLKSSTVALYRDQLDVRDLSSEEHKLLYSSDRKARIRSRINQAILAGTAFLAGGAIVGLQWAYYDVYVPRRAPAILARIKVNNGGAADIRWLVGHHEKLILPGATLKNMDLRNLEDARVSNYTSAQLTKIDFYKSDLNSSNFQQAALDELSFSDTKLRATRFDGAVIRNVSFSKADLTSAAFDGASFCGAVIFSDSDVRGVSFKNVEFPAGAAPVFNHVAWWLISGFNIRQRAMLEKPDSQAKPVNPEEIPALKEDIAEIDGRIRNERSPFARALWLGERAWTLAIYGARLPEARKAIQQAIAQLHELDPPLPADRLDRTTANLHDTEGYIVLQFAAAQPSSTEPVGIGRSARLQEAEKLLTDAMRFDNDGASQFRRAIARYAQGNASDGQADLDEALGRRRYVPTHEMHVLAGLIDEELYKKIQEFTNAGPQPKKPAACEIK